MIAPPHRDWQVFCRAELTFAANVATCLSNERSGQTSTRQGGSGPSSFPVPVFAPGLVRDHGAWAYLHADSQVRREAIVAREMARVSREAEVSPPSSRPGPLTPPFSPPTLRTCSRPPGRRSMPVSSDFCGPSPPENSGMSRSESWMPGERSPSGWISAPMDPRAYRSMDSKTNRERPIFVWVPERPSGRSTSPSSI